MEEVLIMKSMSSYSWRLFGIRTKKRIEILTRPICFSLCSKKSSFCFSKKEWMETCEKMTDQKEKVIPGHIYWMYSKSPMDDSMSPRCQLVRIVQRNYRRRHREDIGSSSADRGRELLGQAEFLIEYRLASRQWSPVLATPAGSWFGPEPVREWELIRDAHPRPTFPQHGGPYCHWLEWKRTVAEKHSLRLSQILEWPSGYTVDLALFGLGTIRDYVERPENESRLLTPEEFFIGLCFRYEHGKKGTVRGKILWNHWFLDRPKEAEEAKEGSSFREEEEEPFSWELKEDSEQSEWLPLAARETLLYNTPSDRIRCGWRSSPVMLWSHLQQPGHPWCFWWSE